MVNTLSLFEHINILAKNNSLENCDIVNLACRMYLTIEYFLYFQVFEQDYEKEKLNERIAKISGGVSVIQVNLLNYV